MSAEGGSKNSTDRSDGHGMKSQCLLLPDGFVVTLCDAGVVGLFDKSLLSSSSDSLRERAAGKTRAVTNDRDDFAPCHRSEFKVGNSRLCQSE